MKQAHSSVSLISANLLRPQFLVMHRLQKTWTWILKQLKRMCFRCWIIRTTLHLSHPTTSPPFPHHLNKRSKLSSLKSDQSSETWRCTSVVEVILYLENLPTEHITSFFVLLPVPVFIKVFTVPDISLLQEVKWNPFQKLGNIGELGFKDEVSWFWLPTDGNSQFRMPLDVVRHVVIDLIKYS